MLAWHLKTSSSLCFQNGRQWFEDMSHFHVIQSHEFCVIAWVAGEAAVIMESLPVAEVKDVLHELLALFLGKPDLPPPSRLVRLVTTAVGCQASDLTPSPYLFV